MIAAAPRRSTFRMGTYNNGQPYAPARGRYAPRERVEDRWSVLHPVIDLKRQKPTAAEFHREMVREIKIRYYQPKTLKNYRNNLAAFLRWFGNAPHLVTRQDVREFLEVLADGGASSSTVSNYLSTIRTTFDKMCGCSVTLGLVTPRRPKRLPVVLSREEIQRLLQAAPSLRDKLLMGIMYATGVRVSEVVRLRYRDLDFDRRVVNVWQGKGRSDRQVLLPLSFEPLLKQLAKTFAPDDYLFPADKPGRHLSPRTVNRVMERARKIAGIGKRATPHSLRHSFSTHMLEDGTDIRFIQKLLGHMRLETTTIYTKVAVIRQQQVRSPLDVLTGQAPPKLPQPSKPSVGKMRISVDRWKSGEAADVRVTILADDARFVYLEGIVVREARPGWVSLELPPLEAWAKPMQWLSREQRERIEEPEFYQLLQEHVGRKFLASKRPPA